MQITKEQIDNDIAGMKQQMENLKASLAQSSGALSVLENIRKYMDLPDPQPEAVPIEDIAEEVAGPGATVEAIEPVEQLITNAQGKYEKRKAKKA